MASSAAGLIAIAIAIAIAGLVLDACLRGLLLFVDPSGRS